jgi:hypothetical protein
VLSSSLADWTVAHGTFQTAIPCLTTSEPIRNRVGRWTVRGHRHQTGRHLPGQHRPDLTTGSVPM